MGDPWDDMYRVNPGFGKRRFSSAEIRDIIVAVFFLTISFFIILTRNNAGHYFSPDRATEMLIWFGIAVLLVVTSFMLHEFAHKIVAQRFGAWAEFRAYIPGLFMGLLFSFLGFLFAAPGAVYIQGRISNEMNGKISAAGPMVNLIVAAIALTLWYVLPISSLAVWITLFYLGYINAFLAFFNLLPIPPLDGSKIYRWNPALYVTMIAIALVMLVICLF